MCRILVKTVLLLGVALAAGWVHSRMVGPLQTELPAQTPVKGSGPAVAPPAPTSPSGNSGPAGGTGTPEPAHPSVPTGPKPPPPLPQNPDTPKPDAKADWFISVQQAKTIYDHGDAVFVDARSFDEYKEGHVPTAVHLDKKYFDGAAGAQIARDKLRGQAVVIYCLGAECTDSEAVAKRLIALNFSIGPIKIIKDGFPGWKAAGYPVDMGG